MTQADPRGDAPQEQQDGLVPGTDLHYAEPRPDESVIIAGRRRLPGRALVLVVAALWLAFLVVLSVVLILWHTTPLHPIDLPG